MLRASLEWITDKIAQQNVKVLSLFIYILKTKWRDNVIKNFEKSDFRQSRSNSKIFHKQKNPSISVGDTKIMSRKKKKKTNKRIVVRWERSRSEDREGQASHTQSWTQNCNVQIPHYVECPHSQVSPQQEMEDHWNDMWWRSWAHPFLRARKIPGYESLSRQAGHHGNTPQLCQQLQHSFSATPQLFPPIGWLEVRESPEIKNNKQLS